MGPASIAIESICDITLANREPGSWLLKDWIAKWRWMVATASAYKIRHVKVYISVAAFYILLGLCSSGFFG